MMTKDWVHVVSHSPVRQILLQIVVRAVIVFSPPAWTSSGRMLSTPADFPFFNDRTVASTSLRRTGWSSSFCVWGQFSTVDPVPSHHTSQERQPAVVKEPLNDQPHQSPKQSHAEDHTEQIEATSGEDHR